MSAIPPKTNPIRDALMGFRDLIKATEPAVIELFAAMSPWLSPVFPAVLTGWNIYHYLLNDWSPGLAFITAFIAALAVESLGISSTHTAVEFWTFNRLREKAPAPTPGKRKAKTPPPDKRSAPFQVAVATGVHYLLTIIAVNIVLESANAGDPADIFAKAMLSTLSITGAVIIGIRAQHGARLTAAQQLADERRANRVRVTSTPDSEPDKADTPRPRLSSYADFAAWMRTLNGQAPVRPADITDMADIPSRQRASEWLKRWKEEAHDTATLPHAE